MNVTILICDEIRIEVNGKIFFIGMYPGNINIPEEGYVANMLQFVFTVTDSVSRVPDEIVFELRLPDDEPLQAKVKVPDLGIEPQHTTWTMRHAVAAVSRPLRFGKIAARIIADGEEHLVAAPWIVPIVPIENATT